MIIGNYLAVVYTLYCSLLGNVREWEEGGEGRGGKEERRGEQKGEGGYIYGVTLSLVLWGGQELSVYFNKLVWH